MQQQPQYPEDPALPRLSIALDAGKMSACFSHYLAEREDSKHCQVRDCKIVRVKYKPGRNCLLGYLLTVIDTANMSSREYRLTARMYSAGKLHSQYCKAAMQKQHPAGIFPGIFSIDALDMLIWCFPNDRKLHHLAALLDTDYLQASVVPKLLTARWGPGHTATHLQQSLVHYAPEHACTVRLQMDVQPPGSSTAERWAVFGKTYYNQTGEHTFSVMQQLRDEPSVISARPILYQPEINTLWQQSLPGKSLHGVDWMTRNPQQLHHAATTLVALHNTRLKDLPRVEITRLVERLKVRSQCLAMACPALKTQLESVVRRLCLHAAICRYGLGVTLHGDLHPQNLFANGERIALIDLDQLETGPASLDLGSWMACCLYHACLTQQPLQQALQQAKLFIDAYAQQTDSWVSWREIAWFTAAALIDERLYRCLSRLKAGRLDIMPTLLDWADQISECALEGCPQDLFAGMSS